MVARRRQSKVLQLLGNRPLAVKGLLPATDTAAASMPQQVSLAHPPRLVSKLLDRGYALACPDMAELLRMACGIPRQILAGQNDLLDPLRMEADVDADDAPRPRAHVEDNAPTTR